MEELNAAPINPLPAAVWVLALPMIAVEVALGLASNGYLGGAEGVGWRAQAYQTLGFAPDQLRAMFGGAGYPATELLRLVSYPFVHGGPQSAIFAVVILLALGKYVGEVFSFWAVLTVYFTATAVAAVAYTLIPPTHYALIGAFPGDYGLIGAFSYILWGRLAGTGRKQWRAFALIGVLMIWQIVFGLIPGGIDWTWVAELAGFCAGYLLSFVVSPGGWSRLLGRIRQR